MFVLVMGGLASSSCLAFRDRKKEDQKEPKQLHGNAKLEVALDGHTRPDPGRDRSADGLLGLQPH